MSGSSQSARSTQRPGVDGLEIVFTGRLSSMTQAEAAERVVERGGTVATGVGWSTDMLVIGQDGWPFRRNGHITRDLELAKRLEDEGAGVQIVDEEAFLAHLGIAAEAATLRRLYSITQLSRILGVPSVRIRSWVRRGLIIPEVVDTGVAFFDFRQVSAARHLNELVDAGVSAAVLEGSLQAVRRWLPEADDAIRRLALVGEPARLVVRLAGGNVAAATGQYRLPLEESAANVASVTATGADAGPKVIHLDAALAGEPETAEGWFERAVALEESDRLEDAVHAYAQCLMQGGPDSEAAFNLGNVLHALGRPTQALRHFYQATDWEPDFAEAWVNLSSVLVELGAWRDAADASRTALRISPGYGDAHYNLALSLHHLGLARDARLHARAYLLQDPASEWANLLRRQLGL